MSQRQTETPRRASASAVVGRFNDQRWLVDSVIRTSGMEWDQPRLGHLNAAMGPEATPDIQHIRQSVKRFSDISRAFAAAAKKRKSRALAALEKHQPVTARDNFYMAAGFYASAQWPIYENSAENLEFNAQKRDSYSRYAELADHRVEAVWLKVGDARIPAWFHLPYHYQGGQIPALVSVPGMDGFKERTVSLYGDRWLNRGVAVLAIEAPGQYECPTLDVYGSMDAWKATGTAAFEWLAARAEIDSDKIAITGNSFGSFIATIAFSNEPRFACCAATATCFEPGHWTIFDQASPTFRARFMYMCGMQTEAQFDRFRRDLTWEGQVEKIRKPYLCVAGEEDNLSPLEHTDRMFENMQASRMLMVYQGANHGPAESPSVGNGPFAPVFVTEWMISRLNREPFASERWFIENSGNIVRTAYPSLP